MLCRIAFPRVVKKGLQIPKLRAQRCDLLVQKLGLTLRPCTGFFLGRQGSAGLCQQSCALFRIRQPVLSKNFSRALRRKRSGKLFPQRCALCISLREVLRLRFGRSTRRRLERRCCLCFIKVGQHLGQTRNHDLLLGFQNIQRGLRLLAFGHTFFQLGYLEHRSSETRIEVLFGSPGRGEKRQCLFGFCPLTFQREGHGCKFRIGVLQTRAQQLSRRSLCDPRGLFTA